MLASYGVLLVGTARQKKKRLWHRIKHARSLKLDLQSLFALRTSWWNKYVPNGNHCN